MPHSPHTLLTAMAEAPSLHWTPCPMCWGQRRIWESVAGANGEGQATSDDEALALLPFYVAERTTVSRVAEVDIP